MLTCPKASSTFSCASMRLASAMSWRISSRRFGHAGVPELEVTVDAAMTDGREMDYKDSRSGANSRASQFEDKNDESRRCSDRARHDGRRRRRAPGRPRPQGADLARRAAAPRPSSARKAAGLAAASRRGDRARPISSCRSCRPATRSRWRSGSRPRSPPATPSRCTSTATPSARRPSEKVAAALAPTGSPFVDAGIIGSPPPPKEGKGPRFYASGPHAPRFAELKEFGLDVRVLAGPLSAASAMKMSYAGITKGTQALGAVMMLAATRGGIGRCAVRGAEGQPAANARPTCSARCRSCRPRPIAGSRRCTRSPTSSARIRPGTSFIPAPRISTSRSRRDFDGDRQEVDALMAFLNKDKN